LKVMLVFARFDHVQAAVTKPHIHQAWDGFFHLCRFWIRMNPDLAYCQSVDPNDNLEFPDNRANEEPKDWKYIEDWGFPVPSQQDVWLASVAEMADRVYKSDWSDDLESVFFPVLVDSGNNIVEKQDSQHLIPETHCLLPSFPNPFNQTTSIPVELSHQEHVRLMVYDLHGESIKTLYNDDLTAGRHLFQWNAEYGPTGIYICRLQFSHGCTTQKLLFLK